MEEQSAFGSGAAVRHDPRVTSRAPPSQVGVRKRQTTAVKAGGPYPAIDKAISKSDKFESFSRTFKLTLHIIQFYSNPKLCFFIERASVKLWFNN